MTAWHSESGVRVVLGVTGGIAAYKAVQIARQLVTRGHSVKVIPTHSALKFVGRPTWEAISRNPVDTEVFDSVAEVTHVALGQQADLVIVAPATAHFVSQYATGQAADLLGTTLLATQAPVLIAPAMHTEMWSHPATLANITTLRERGVEIIGPDSGRLTGDDEGPGRMSDPIAIVERGLSLLGDRPLQGTRVLISAGGTRERLDAVRFIGNYSSGAMGVALAEVARDRGAQVTLVHAALEVPLPSGVECVPALSASHMRDELVSRTDTSDWVVLAAAVADYSPAQVETGKITKAQAGERYSPELVQTPDIAAEIGRTKPSGQKLVTFSAETIEGDDELIARARQKGADKGADVVVANRVGDGLGFGQTETAVWIIQRSGAPVLSTGSKQTVAGHLFDVLPNV